MNIFGSNYSEIGSLSENLVLNTAGKVKIRFGNKFIDILDDKGNLNVKIPKVVTKIESLDTVNLDGFYLIDKILYLKLGTENILITSDDLTGYIEYSNELKLSEEEIKIVQKNIGLSLNSLNNIPIKEGIVFVGNTIYKVKLGKALEYLLEPLKGINELKINPNYDNTAIVWKNALWKYIPIITKEYLETYTKQINDSLERIRNEINRDTLIDIFEKNEYSGNIFTISNFDYDFKESEGEITSLKGLNVSTTESFDVSENDLLYVTIPLLKVVSDNNYENTEYTFYLKKSGDNLVFMDKEYLNSIEFLISKYSEKEESLIINTGEEELLFKPFKSSFLSKHIFVKQEEEFPNKFNIDYNHSQIAFEEKTEDGIVPHVVIGDLDDTEKKYNDPAKSFRTRNGTNDKQFKTGLYCDLPVFNGAEFRGKWPDENINMYDSSADYSLDYPRYSSNLNNNICLMLPNLKYDPSKNTFPEAFKSVIPSMEWVYRYALPVGSIIMYSGKTIPRGWAICDGTNGTPNLTNRFIVAAGGDYALNATGGEKTVTLTTSQIPSHSHSVDDYYYIESSEASGSAISGTTPVSATFGPLTEHDEDNNILYYKTHNTGTKGGGGAHNNLPPYYALYFIMKIPIL